MRNSNLELFLGLYQIEDTFWMLSHFYFSTFVFSRDFMKQSEVLEYFFLNSLRKRSCKKNYIWCNSRKDWTKDDPFVTSTKSKFENLALFTMAIFIWYRPNILHIFRAWTFSHIKKGLVIFGQNLTILVIVWNWLGMI